jgi:hypothetical protein
LQRFNGQFLLFPIAAHECDLWSKVCQRADCRAGAVEGAFFQGMTKTEKEQKQCTFGEFTKRRRAERCHYHQQVSIEMFLFDCMPGVLRNIPTAEDVCGDVESCGNRYW